MSYCGQCGTQAKPGANFCSGCGHPHARNTPAKQSVPETSGPDGKDALIEAFEIGAEVIDIEAFSALCSRDPDKALLKIAKLERVVPNLGAAHPVPVLKFLATAQKALDLYESNGNVPGKTVQGLCEQCMREYIRAGVSVKSVGAESAIRGLEPQLDEVAMRLEKIAPGKVQELLGTTKLKYISFADRLSIANEMQEHLTREDIRETLELHVSAPFIIRSVMFGSLLNVGSRSQLGIALYEQPDMWGPFGKMNPIKGHLNMVKNNAPGSHWRIA